MIKNSFYKFPKKVMLIEVGARDGLQNENKILTLTQKTKFVNMLTDCGFRKIEIGSFVSENRVPQMKHTLELSKHIYKNIHANYITLVPKSKFLQKFLKSMADEIAVFTTTSNEFSIKNTGMTISQSLEEIQQICRVARQNCIPVRGYISTIGECPYSGEQKKEEVLLLVYKLLQMGCYQISLGETLGKTCPNKMDQLLSYLSEHINPEILAVHFHDTYGYAIENIKIALKYGISNIDCSIGGLGGCPYAKGSGGNVATENVVELLDNMGIEHGISIEKLLETKKYVFDILEK